MRIFGDEDIWVAVLVLAGKDIRRMMIFRWWMAVLGLAGEDIRMAGGSFRIGG